MNSRVGKIKAVLFSSIDKGSLAHSVLLSAIVVQQLISKMDLVIAPPRTATLSAGLLSATLRVDQYQWKFNLIPIKRPYSYELKIEPRIPSREGILPGATIQICVIAPSGCVIGNNEIAPPIVNLSIPYRFKVVDVRRCRFVINLNIELSGDQRTWGSYYGDHCNNLLRDRYNNDGVQYTDTTITFTNEHVHREFRVNYDEIARKSSVFATSLVPGGNFVMPANVSERIACIGISHLCNAPIMFRTNDIEGLAFFATTYGCPALSTHIQQVITEGRFDKDKIRWGLQRAKIYGFTSVYLWSLRKLESDMVQRRSATFIIINYGEIARLDDATRADIYTSQDRARDIIWNLPALHDRLNATINM